jgi:hypothetical protein
MSLLAELENDLQTIFADWGETFVVALNGVTVKEIAGIFDQAVETISPGTADHVVLRPAVSFRNSDFAGLGKSHAFRRQATGDLFRVYGDPVLEGGLTRLFLVK